MSRAIGQNSLTPDLNFRLVRDQVVLLTNDGQSASRRGSNDFYAVFFLFRVERYNKTLNYRPRGKK